MPVFEWAQHKLYYEQSGSQEGSRLLFLHGFLGRGDDFCPVGDALADFCCLAVDLPGHGQTLMGKGPYDMLEISEGLVQLLKSLDYLPCSLVGYSMGGRLALLMAYHFPQYFSGILLASASPGLETEAERSRRRRQDAALAIEIETGAWPEFVRRWYAQPLFSGLQSLRDPEAFLQKRFENCPAELARSLRSMGTGTQPSLWDALPHIYLPITLVVGALDAKFLALNQRMLQRTTAQLWVIPNCGHMVHLEAIAEFAKIVRHSALRSSPTALSQE